MLALVFFMIALLYSIIGFGGGSSYLAILASVGISYQDLPKISLICNLLVTTGGCFYYWRHKHLNSKLILPFVLSSIPMAFLGGLCPISEIAFSIILAMTLTVAGVRLLFISTPDEGEIKSPDMKVSVAVGVGLGFLSGLVGLGGGIFLSPLLMNMRWGRVKEIAATACVFIWLNSLAGLIGQFIKTPATPLLEYWPLFVAVIVGGQVGSRLSASSKLNAFQIQRATGVLITLIALNLLMKLV